MLKILRWKPLSGENLKEDDSHHFIYFHQYTEQNKACQVFLAKSVSILKKNTSSESDGKNRVARVDTYKRKNLVKMREGS